MAKIPKMTQEQYAKQMQKAQAIDMASQLVNIGTQAVGAYVAQQDAKKREEFNQNLSLVSEEQKEKFATQLAKAKNEEERLKLLSEYFVALTNKRIDKIDDIIQAQEIQKRNALVKNYVVYGAITLGLILTFVLLNKKK